MAWMGVPAALNNRLWARLRARNAVSSFMVFSKSARCSSLKGCTYLMIITSSGRGEYATKSGLTLMRYCISIVSKNFWSGTYCANKKENAGRVANYLRTMGTIWRALSRHEIMMMGQIAYLDAYGLPRPDGAPHSCPLPAGEGAKTTSGAGPCMSTASLCRALGDRGWHSVPGQQGAVHAQRRVEFGSLSRWERAGVWGP